VSQPKIAKKSLKPIILGVQGRSMSSMSVPPERSSVVLVITGSKSVSICNLSHVRSVDSSRNRAWVPKFDALVRRTRWTGHGLNLACQNLRLMLNISYAGCLGLSSVITVQFYDYTT